MSPPSLAAGSTGPTGVLVVRVWYEGTAADRELRVRLTGRADVTRDAEESAWRSTIPESVDYLREWLERFSTAADPGRTEGP